VIDFPPSRVKGFGTASVISPDDQFALNGTDEISGTRSVFADT
jgi:hypothetical protein